MIDLLVRQIPDELHAKLKQSARANRRSMNQAIIVLLEQSLAEEHPRPLPLPQPLQGAFPIDDEWLRQAREEGRAGSSSILMSSPTCSLPVKRRARRVPRCVTMRDFIESFAPDSAV